MHFGFIGMSPLLQFLALIAALFALVPGFAWMTGDRRDAWVAAKGFGVVCLVLFVIPGAIGFLVVGIMQLMGS